MGIYNFKYGRHFKDENEMDDFLKSRKAKTAKPETKKEKSEEKIKSSDKVKKGDMENG